MSDAFAEPDPLPRPPQPPDSGDAASDAAKGQPIEKKVIKRAGGRHLVFRINKAPFWFVPKPYALISNIEGSILIFYGLGQIWVTHRKLRRINDWLVRIPRFVSKRTHWIVDELEPEIAAFVNDVRELDLIGTLLIERRVIEFHWTLPGDQRSEDSSRHQQVAKIDTSFNKLATAFAKLQLTGKEGEHDAANTQIDLKSADV